MSWHDWLKDVEAFVGHVEQHPAAGEVVPVGHSFGGLVVLSAVLHEVLQSRRFVVSNPALRLRMSVPGWKVRLGRAAARLVPTLTLPSGLDPNGISRNADAVRAYRDDPLVHDRISARLFAEWTDASAELQRRAADLRTPYLMVLADADPIVDHRAATEFAAATVNAPHDVRVFEGRYHEPFNDLGADEVYDAIAAWLT